MPAWRLLLNSDLRSSLLHGHVWAIREMQPRSKDLSRSPTHSAECQQNSPVCDSLCILICACFSYVVCMNHAARSLATWFRCFPQYRRFYTHLRNNSPCMYGVISFLPRVMCLSIPLHLYYICRSRRQCGVSKLFAATRHVRGGWPCIHTWTLVQAMPTLLWLYFFIACTAPSVASPVALNFMTSRTCMF